MNMLGKHETWNYTLSTIPYVYYVLIDKSVVYVVVFSLCFVYHVVLRGAWYGNRSSSWCVSVKIKASVV